MKIIVKSQLIYTLLNILLFFFLVYTSVKKNGGWVADIDRLSLQLCAPDSSSEWLLEVVT